MANKDLAVKLALDNGNFKQGIADLQQSLKVVDSGFKASVAGVKDWGGNLDALKNNASALTDKIKLQKDIVSAYSDELGKQQSKLDKSADEMLRLKDAVEKTTKEYKDSVEQTGKNSEESQQLETKLKSLESQYKQTENEVVKNKNSVNKLTVEYNNAQGEVNSLEKQLEQTTDAMQSQEKESGQLKNHLEALHNAASKVGGVLGGGLKVGAGLAAGGIAAISAAAVVAVSKIADLTKQSIELADSVLTTSQVYGLNTSYIQKMTYAASKLDVEAEAVFASQTKLTKAIYAAKEGTGAQAEAFKALGVEVKYSDGTFKDAVDVQYEVFDALNDVNSSTERDAIAMVLLGKSAMELNPLIKAGGDELRKLSNEAERMGAVVDYQALVALDNFGDNLEALKIGFRGTAATLTAIMMPALTEFLGMTQNLLSAFATAREKKDYSIFFDELNATIDVAVDAIGEYLPKFITAAGEIIQSLAEGLIENAPALFGAAVNAVTSFVEFITEPETLDLLLDAAFACLTALAKGLIDQLTLIIPAVFQIITKIVTELSKPANVQAITDAAVDIVVVLADGLATNLAPIIDATLAIIRGVVSGLLSEENKGKLVQAAKDIAWTLLLGMMDYFTQLTGAQWLTEKLFGKDKMDAINAEIFRKGESSGESWATGFNKKAVGAPRVSGSGGGHYSEFAVGSRYVPYDMHAIVHQGEMIVPKSENPYANSGGAIAPRGLVINFSGTVVGSNGMNEFAEIISQKVAGGYGLVSGGDY